LKGAEKLQEFAYSTPEKNRLMGSKGHNDTVKYLKKTLESLDGYYKVELQPFSSPVQINGTFALTVDGTTTESGAMEYSPSGNVSAPLVVVSNLGCEAVSIKHHVVLSCRTKQYTE
jgi:hypothetical protein